METDRFLTKIVLMGTMMRLLYPLPQGPLCQQTVCSLYSHGQFMLHN